MTAPGVRCAREGFAHALSGSVLHHAPGHEHRYTPDGPVSDRPWPAMPDAFLDVARRAAMAAGYTPPPAAAGEVLGPILTAALDRHTTCARWAAYFVEPI